MYEKFFEIFYLLKKFIINISYILNFLELRYRCVVFSNFGGIFVVIGEEFIVVFGLVVFGFEIIIKKFGKKIKKFKRFKQYKLGKRLKKFKGVKKDKKNKGFKVLKKDKKNKGLKG